VSSHVGGESHAKAKLEVFLTERVLKDYHKSRNDPSRGLQSHLSPHIQFGQISVVEVARKAIEFRRSHADDADMCASVDVFLDELIVRRELAINFALRNDKYDAYEGLPRWARDTLRAHADDARQWTYTKEEFERGKTHDKLWNAAQRELVSTGKQHNYLRMYWGKKILEWTASPEEAWRIAIALNNKYSLDGRNMVSLTGVGWCFGLHDREFHDVSITGTIRRFSEGGMKKKFPVGMRVYLERWGDDGGEKRQLRLEDMFGSKRTKTSHDR
jgi:deoxyribodipyrimidine photo-lyase